jgi:protein-tyrosine phosphatase
VAARAAAAAAGLAIRIEPGGEVDLEYAASWSDPELRRFTLGGGTTILIEFPWGGVWPLALAPTCAALRRRGFLPVVAHPERARVVQHDPDRVRELTSAGAVCQLTAASLAGVFGDAPRAAAFTLLDRGLAHLVSSDAHNATSRGPRLVACRAALAVVYGEAYAEALMSAAALVAAGEPPPLLQAQRTTRKRRFRRPAP